MPDTPITLSDLIASRTEIKEVVKELGDDVRAGFARTEQQFAAVNVRFDHIGDRLRDVEVASGEHGVKLTNLEREVFDRSKHLSLVPPLPGTQSPQSKADDEFKPITRREVGISIGSISAFVAVVKYLWPLVKP